eukprot:5668907-Amphidinium_carterae.1
MLEWYTLVKASGCTPDSDLAGGVGPVAPHGDGRLYHTNEDGDLRVFGSFLAEVYSFLFGATFPQILHTTIPPDALSIASRPVLN